MSPPFAAVALMMVLPLAAARGEPIPWEEAARHVGKEVEVEGRVMAVHCSPTSCLLAFEPTFDRFTAVVQAQHFQVFPPAELEERFPGRRVRVRGVVRLLEGKPEIVLDEPGDLVLADSAAREAERSAALAEAQTEILERLEAILESIEAISERLVTTQQRIETLLGQLEQRAAQHETTPTLESQPGPAVPRVGAVPSRAASQALRSLKRGMSAATVRRLVGDPLTVEPGVSGGETWHYGYGRSVSFDGRGRVVALVGFSTR